MAIDVFMSVGRTSTPSQEEMVSAIERYLTDIGLVPRTIGRTDFATPQPLKAIKQLMEQCGGTIVIAFERIHIKKAKERSFYGDDNRIKNESLPTVWNQIEAAMAYVLGQPLLIIGERGLRREGLLEMGYDWYIQWVDTDGPIVNDPRFVEIVAQWKQQVEQYNQTKEANND